MNYYVSSQDLKNLGKGVLKYFEKGVLKRKKIHLSLIWKSIEKLYLKGEDLKCLAVLKPEAFIVACIALRSSGVREIDSTHC